MLMSMIGVRAFAHDFEVANDDGVTIYYVKTSDTEVAVSFRGDYRWYYSDRYTGYVNIPEIVYYDGVTYNVTSIGESAFYNCSNLTWITIPNSVTTIEDRAFSNCTGLTYIVIPEYVTTIGYYAFSGTSLTAVTIPNRVTSLKSWAFQDCTNLTSVTIPNTLDGNSMSYDTFEGCTNLTQVNLNSNNIVKGSSVKEFFGDQVTEYILGDDVTSIGSNAFYKCSKLTSVTIGKSVTEIGNYAFQDCSSLATINIPESVTKIGYGAFSGCSALTSVTLGDGVTSIATKAFAYCGLTSVTIPKYVFTIGEDAFYSCSDLKQVTINSSIVDQLNKLSSYFGGQVTEYIIGEGVTSIGAQAFDDCSNLTSVTLPSTVTFIGTEAFYRCKNLTSITLPDALTTIGERAFNSSGLTSITIPESVTSIYRYAFAWCEDLSTITLPDGLESISEGTFSGCSGLTSITIPEGVTSIGNQAFYNCTKLTQVILNSNDIVSATYTEKSNIGTIFGAQVKDYILGDEVQAIGDYAFNGCDDLNSITFGDNIQTIGSDALPSCKYYVNRGTYGLLHLWNSGLDPIATGTTDVLYRPSVTVGDITQTTATVQLDNIGYADYVFTYGDQEITSTTISLTGLRPEQPLPSLKASLGEVSFSTGGEYTTSAIAPSVDSTPSATAISATGSYIEGDALVTGQRMTLNGTTVEGNNIKVTKLEPRTTYTVTYEIDVAYGESGQETYTYTGTADVTTDFVTLTTLQPKVISAGNVVVSAESNLDDEEANVGFEWRRLDWGSDFESNTGKAYFYEGTLEGFIRNLHYLDNTLWKYRPFYETVAGNKYYGDWMGIDPMNIGDYEPTVHTYSSVSVMGNTVSVKGYAQRGTDNITSQGFKYWKISDTTDSQDPSSDIPKDAKTIEASGTVMEASLTDLDGKTAYVAFVTTSGGNTYYGEIKTFDTDVSPETLGDANGDGTVNVADIVEIVNYILGNPSSQFNFEEADVNVDGKVDAKDILEVVSIILSSNARAFVDPATATTNLKVSGADIMLRNAENYTAAQFDINLSTGQSISNISLNGNSNHQLKWQMIDATTCRVVAYSLTNAPFGTTDDVLFNITASGSITISNELLINAPDSGTGINTLKMNKSADVYDLRGNKVRSNTTDLNGLRKGIYIVNGKKVMVK